MKTNILIFHGVKRGGQPVYHIVYAGPNDPRNKEQGNWVPKPPNNYQVVWLQVEYQEWSNGHKYGTSINNLVKFEED